MPCRGGVPPLEGEELLRLSAQLPDWKVIEQHHIRKTFLFPDFRKALDFVNRVGEVAEEQGHHPDLALSWGKVDVEIYTHKINGLTESDFILAAKIDRVFFQ
ncbi:MAG TPA: 4a-hydroxytetrahydrobiopterin dehydratase [Bryobacteraceae bacterium]|nr:4a-hydroxytetrahydrobiopterin dehydratase [Bryobacteraceae bacterium]